MCEESLNALCGCKGGNILIEIKANRVTVSINDNGCIADIKYFDGTSLFHGTFVPFLRTGSGGRMFYPERATFNGKELAFMKQMKVISMK